MKGWGVCSVHLIKRNRSDPVPFSAFFLLFYLFFFVVLHSGGGKTLSKKIMFQFIEVRVIFACSRLSLSLSDSLLVPIPSRRNTKRSFDLL